MLNKKSKKFIKATAFTVVAIILSLSLIVTFARDTNIPTWDDIFVTFGLRERLLPKDADDYIIFLDVGQGDSALIVSNGQTALIDTGEQAYSNKLYNKLRRYNISEIDFFLGSHIHSDHIGALPNLMENISIKNIMLNFKEYDDDAQSDILNQVNSISKSQKINTFNPVRAAVVNIGDFEITVIGFYNNAVGENNRSIFIMAKINDYKFLLTGDAEEQAEKLLLNDNINVNCDVLKVAHHGSKTSSCKEFINATSPKYAIISCGINNDYGHPNKDVINRFEKAKTKVMRTDVNSDIAFEIKNNDIIVYTAK